MRNQSVLGGQNQKGGKNQIQDNIRDEKEKQVKKNLAAEIGRFVIPMPNDFGDVRIVVRTTKIGDGTVVVKPKIAATTA